MTACHRILTVRHGAVDIKKGGVIMKIIKDRTVKFQKKNYILYTNNYKIIWISSLKLISQLDTKI